MLDFTSSLYLGLEHAWSSLPAWPRLTLGKPAALAELDGTARIERDLAALVGCEAAVLGPSTLHLFWDLFAMLAERGANIFLDRGVYPIARWGAERTGAPMRSFAHHDADSLRDAMARSRGKAIVVTNGFCPVCGRAAPVADYLECAAATGGMVVVDDTQALGIFGHGIGQSPPYGIGGSGSLGRLARRDDVLVVSSLAKGLGVPIAMLGASTRMAAKFRESSATRMHCSPPSAAVLAAAGQALETNRRIGDVLRRRLADRVAWFRDGLRQLGLPLVPGYFPVQPVCMPAEFLYRELLRRGIQAVLQRASDEAPMRVSLVFTAQHSLTGIGRVVDVLAGILSRGWFEIKRGAKDNAIRWI